MSRYLLQRALGHRASSVSRKSRRVPVELSHSEEEFFEHLGESADVRLEPGINQDEFFDDQFERRAHEIQRTPAASSAITVVPAKQGPWSGNNQLGIERPYQPDGDGYQTILRLDEWDFPQVWTVSLGLNYIPQLISGAGNAQFGVVAVVEFGSGGVMQTFELDWGEGVTFSLPMNALNLIARYSDFTTKNNTPADLVLRANLGRHGSRTGIPPTKSFQLLVDTGGANAEFVLIPKFARRLRVQRGAGTTAGAWSVDFVYTFFGTDGPAGDAGGFNGDEYLQSFASSGVPIPPSARSVRVSNASGSAEAVLLLFDLSF